MRILHVTTWNEVCGIAEVTHHLVHMLQANGHTCGILPARKERKLVQTCCEKYVQVEPDVWIKDWDVVHVQYQSFIYPEMCLGQIFNICQQRNTPVIVTFHDSCIGPQPWDGISCSIVHTPYLLDSVPGRRRVHIPHGVPVIPYAPRRNQKTIGSFGLGRNQDEMVKQAIEGTNVQFLTTYGHYKWLPFPDLVKFIQDLDVVTLLFPPVTAHVSSSTVRVAIGCRRPIITTPTQWFAGVDCVTRVQNVEELKVAIVKALHDECWLPGQENFIKENSWARIVKMYEGVYQSVIRK